MMDLMRVWDPNKSVHACGVKTVSKDWRKFPAITCQEPRPHLASCAKSLHTAKMPKVPRLSSRWN